MVIMDVNDEAQFSYVKSCQLPVKMRIKINSVDKQRPPPTSLLLLQDPVLAFSPWAHPTKAADLMVECVVMDGKHPFPLVTQTAYTEMTSRWDWYEWLELPMLVCDLPRNSQLEFTVWDTMKRGEKFCIGKAMVSVFDVDGEMRTGKKDLRLIGDPKKEDTPEMRKIVHRLNELDERLSKYERGQTAQVDWMDRLAFREIGELTEKLKRDSGSLFLNIDFPTFKNGQDKLSVLFFEQGYISQCSIPKNPKYCKQYDPSAGQENIVENKHLALARSLRSGLDDRDIRPNAEVKKKLTEIMDYPPTTVLTGPELDLVWKHRYYLSEHKAGLTKFVKCINWSSADQKKEALQLLNSWAVLDAENALELLGPSFTVPEVRQYAVSRLWISRDEDLKLYLLQLVQALKYEPFVPDTFTFNEGHYSDDFDIIGTEKEQRNGNSSSNNGNKSINNTSVQKGAATNSNSNINKPASTSSTINPTYSSSGVEHSSNGSCAGGAVLERSGGGGGLLELLVCRAGADVSMATSLYWFLRVETQTGAGQETPSSIICRHGLERLLSSLRSGDSSARYTAHMLTQQDKLVHKLVGIVEEMRSKSLSREQKMRYLRNSLADPVLGVARLEQPLPLPLDPAVMVTGLDLDGLHVFKSALEPCKLTFTTIEMSSPPPALPSLLSPAPPGAPYHTIFKVGDDLRQDQLILQLLTLMDGLLLRENLDLKLTPYRVLATAPTHGFVQFIDAAVLADILREDGSILNYLRRKQPDLDAPAGVAPQALDNLTRSCAGYSIITYILGVGDRHHDNLMLTDDGCFFHIDFGYILGRDPKPLPPLIKLSREMTDGLGGQNSEQYQQFKQLCRTTFLSLRRHANLVLNLFSLMVDAGIPDIALEPEKAVRKVAERLHLDLTDEEASSKILSVLHESANAVFGAVAENLHKFTQYIRN